MLLQRPHRALYASFDRFPSPKGAATHISRFATTLFDSFDGGLLYVLGDEELPVYQNEEGVEILRYHRDHTNFLDRTLGFGQRLEALLDEQEETLELCHFRDPWSGVPVLSRPHRYATVYEVNGLPSIELPFTYPYLSPATLTKIRTAEEFCWHHADAIVTPSRTIAENIIRLGAPEEKITVIPNGADVGPDTDEGLRRTESAPVILSRAKDLDGADEPARSFANAQDDNPDTNARTESSPTVGSEFYSEPSDERSPRNVDAALYPAPYIIYFGALQRWQGVDTLLRAFARLADLRALHLVICSSTHRRHVKIYQKLAERLGIAERIIWQYGLKKEELADWLRHASLSVAPLTECSRNLDQGCAPLKILESMAHGVPVVASDLPAVREIISDGVEGRLVRAERPAELARVIRVLLEYPDALREMGERGRHRIETEFTWEQATVQLAELYQSLSIISESSSGHTITEHSS